MSADKEERLPRSATLQNAGNAPAVPERVKHDLIAANAALSETNARLRLAMDSGQLGEWDLDATTDRITLGPRAAQMYGLQQGVSYARSQVRELSHPQDAARVRQMLEQALADHHNFILEYRVLRRDGGVRWIASSGRGRYAPDGTLLGMTGVMQDITERKRVEAELNEAKAVAEQANIAKSEFLSSMSHELRSPLHSILGFAQLIESGSPPPSLGQKASIDQIRQAGWHLLALINEVLDLSLIESGKVSFSRQPLPLAEVLGECRAMIETQAAKNDVRVTFHPLDGPGLVLADRTRTKQVLINLLSNAIKYNRMSGTLDVRCSTVGAQRVRVSVADTGQGMTPEHIAQLFQPFNRLGKETGAEEGTGIGLVVSKRLVEMMGGTIGVRSVLGMGSEFWFELDSTCGVEPDHPVEPASSLSLHT